VVSKIRGIQVEEQEMLFEDVLSYENIIAKYKKACGFIKNNVV
jgi:hypothetical protein